MDTKRVKKEICSGSLENVAENNCLSKPPKHSRRIIIETDQLQWKFMSRRKEINFRSIIVEVIPIQLSVLSGLHNTWTLLSREAVFVVVVVCCLLPDVIASVSICSKKTYRCIQLIKYPRNRFEHTLHYRSKSSDSMFVRCEIETIYLSTSMEVCVRVCVCTQIGHHNNHMSLWVPSPNKHFVNNTYYYFATLIYSWTRYIWIEQRMCEHLNRICFYATSCLIVHNSY